MRRVDRVLRGGALWSAVVVLGVTVPVGYGAERLSTPLVHDRYFPWIVGRTLGLSAYAALFALVILGLWLRHPWRQRWPVLHPETSLRFHAALGGAAVVLVAGHLVALASDRYAGVGWVGTVVPDASHYRPVAVTLGVFGFDALVVVVATAAVGGRLVGRHWLSVHRLALPTAGVVWLHGVLAGTDTPRLRAGYAVSGGLVVLMALSRALTSRARPPVSEGPGQPSALGLASAASARSTSEGGR
ncbi:MAG TPA: hypothetical protein VKU86_02730 [Acidimicrobiales bacterium]|nr:hypothetical protein [Acidimicrobiales bacterium]